MFTKTGGCSMKKIKKSFFGALALMIGVSLCTVFATTNMKVNGNDEELLQPFDETAGFVDSLPRGDDAPSIALALADSGFTFTTNGTYDTINENLINGFNVSITAGSGDLILSGQQTGVLTIYNNDTINLVNGNFTRTIYLTNTTVSLIGTTVNTTSNYALEVNSNVHLYIDAASYVKVNSGYASAIIVNENNHNIQMKIDGIVESNMQGIGVTSGSVVDSIIVNGTMQSNANYGLIADTASSEVTYVEFSESSSAVNPAGIVVYASALNSSFGDVILNGTIDARVIMTVGTATATGSVNTITLNNYATVRGGAFFLNGNVQSLTITEEATIDQMISSYGVLYTNIGTNIQEVNYLGTFFSTYLLIDEAATSHIGTINIDPIALEINTIITNNVLLWVTGTIEQVVVSDRVIETDNVFRAINLQGTANVKNMIFDQSIIDAQQLSDAGYIFNNKENSQMFHLTFQDSLLFGDAVNTKVDGINLTHLEPRIETSNYRLLDNTLYMDVELPELSDFSHSMETGVKLTFMYDDYTHTDDFMYYGGKQTVAIPEQVRASGREVKVVNYASYDLEDAIILTSHRSEDVNINTTDYGVFGEDVTYPVGHVVDDEQYIQDANITYLGSEEDLAELVVDLSEVNFHRVGNYPVMVKAVYADGFEATITLRVTIIADSTPPKPDKENGGNYTASATSIATADQTNPRGLLAFAGGSLLLILLVFSRKYNFFEKN